jgi:hypothetical protein
MPKRTTRTRKGSLNQLGRLASLMERLLRCGRSPKLATLLLLLLLCVPTGALAADPPPAPSKTSTVGMVVTNPVTNLPTTVSALVVDPDGTPTAGATGFVQTQDGYTFFVKSVGETFWINGTSLKEVKVLPKEPVDPAGTVRIQSLGGAQEVQPINMLTSSYDAQFNPAPGMDGDPPLVPKPSGPTLGYVYAQQGGNGRSGRDATLWIDGGRGGDGGTPIGNIITHSANLTVNTSASSGITIYSIGGNGGNGGDIYFGWSDPGTGGKGGAGGLINLTNNAQIQTSGNGNHGINAYSVSGKGGNGGEGYVGAGGGYGGTSGGGGPVVVENNGSIFTAGEGAHGILAVSRSGQGGAGGSTFGLVGSGGSGAQPGNGGTVTVTNTQGATIQTKGLGSHGIFAMSVGGQGGAGGSADSLFTGSGGDGGGGGDGKPVQVINNGTIITLSELSRGIFAQSVGGGGGSGGNSAGLVAFGGTGSLGGSSGTVAVTNSGGITTSGRGSDGIFAQSVAGSGGSGGNADGLVSLGGGAGPGGDGKRVDVTNTGTIVTSKALVRSTVNGKPVFTQQGGRGIVAQSIGGGGGDGGSATGMVSVGGGGSGGGYGGLVNVTNAGEIFTKGTDAAGIFAQSVGGGGGNGGSATSVGLFAAVAIGGNGSVGGKGGSVNVTLQGQSSGAISKIQTEGRNSFGVFAQSVGGGGGNGGGATSISGGFGGALSIGIGGTAGPGGNGGIVMLDDGTGGTNEVTTLGDHSTGVFAQSVGGGGGNGGFATSVAVSAGPVAGSVSVGVGGKGGIGGIGDTVVVGSDRFTSGPLNGQLIGYDGVGALTAGDTGFNGKIHTKGDYSTGFIAQSVGGGGGNGGMAVSVPVAASAGGSAAIGVGVGGDAASGSIGGEVRVGTAGNMLTEGAFSPGMLVQSVGGGGGNGGSSVVASVAASAGAAGAVSVGLGGKGGTGSTGGNVNLATGKGLVWTKGESSTGITVQSVGGGGGNGGFNVSAALAGAGGAAGAVSVGLGGDAGAGGKSGIVKAHLQSDVITEGVHSTGVLAQAVGGGGGNGGFNVSAAIGGAGGAAGAVSVGLGGKGGEASAGGIVDATATGNIFTKGHSSSGFVAQSVGGGGGNGGFNVSAAAAGAGAAAGSVGVGLGGTAGGGGAGGKVTASTGDDAVRPGVITQGDNSTGILAQSVGGGGGNGGFNVSVAVSGAGVAAGSVGVGLGGSGGAGGDGGEVDLTVRNNVSTGFVVTGLKDITGAVTDRTGHYSAGVIAQSVGGGGGNGGFNVTAGIAGSGKVAGGVGIGLGGDGAKGGKSAEKVTLDMEGNITTRGDYAGGLIAQSVGGGGGNGGFNVSAAISGAGVASGQVGVGLGGSAGYGGSATGLVKSSLTGNVITDGDYSSGVTAQSVGGGGGNGGFNITGAIGGAGTASASVGVGLGGSGGKGGHSGASVIAVVVDNTVKGNVTTNGRNSHAIVAQSMGGGGGNGGFDITGSISGAGVGSGAVSVGLGGSGGDGGHSAGVNNYVEGTSVTTKKNDSVGILAQSVGGGGGSGGFSISGSISGAGTGSGAVSVGLGGSGGGGGHAGAVTNTVIVDEISTDGAGDTPEEAGNSAGVVAQSLGGGGGNGGFSIAGAISGAGTGSGAVGVGLGGSGGAGGNSSNVKHSVTGNVTTKRQESVGIIAQSLGGGGGNGGFSVTGAITGAGTGSAGVSVGIGGSGGGGGNSGANISDLVVDNTVTGNVTTEGTKSSAVVAQALGGGGGNGGFSVAAVLSGAGTASGNVSVGIGGSGGDGGNAGRVKNSVTGAISTQSDESDGVLAQSVGGGGGNGGFNVSGAITGAGKASAGVGVGIGGSGGNGGHSGAVVIAGAKGDGTVDVLLDNSILAVDNVVTGNVTTEGAKSNGVVAQSIGGGGGNGGFNVSAVLSGAGTASGAISVGIGGSGGDGGHSGSVRNLVTGNVSTGQKESTGVIAQSVGGGGGNGGFNVSGNISGGSKASAGLSVGIGGSGGGGGQSGNVDNTVIGNVSTIGADSGGVLAQSIGGGGGNGGFNISGVISAGGNGSGAVSVGIGGSGGDGGSSGNVVNRVIGDVMTSGKGSNAILAQSVGGGGGNGGFSITGAINLSKENGGTLGVGIGGFGGKGGNSGNVTSTVTTAALNQTATTGENAAAVVAQSIGGGGGNGGVNVTGTLTLTGKTGASIGVGVGGFGGEAGNAGNAGATVTGNYFTTGKNSDGIVVQSLGGGGGNGGLNVTGSLGLSTGGSSGQASVGIGGFGGDGGSSGTATLLRTGDTITSGADSEAIIVQSLAGGGGNGGVNITAGLTASKSDNASLNFGLGGFGGEGSNADTVSATIIGNVSATGLGEAAADAPPQLFSGAVVAQSVGGGGGKGGLNVAGGVTLTKSNSSGKVATIGIGGFGGGGGNGGDVNLDIHAPGTDQVSVVANGDNRAGVIAQSLGGGGGLGGINISGGISTNSALAFGMGGFGGDGGVSKNVDAKVTADIQVTGDGTRGLVAQSLGGGGGAGGINVSGTVNINSSDDTSITFGLGGFGGAGNISGDVDVTQKGRVIVKGENGIGILAQSVAGGGGDGGLNVSANIANASAGKSTNRIVAGVGGTAGSGADAGNVSVNSLGVIAINGPGDKPDDEEITVFNSAGILAQSIGGGGGLGGMNISASVARNAGNTLQFGMGGSGGAGGNAGTVGVIRGYDSTLAGEVVNATSIQTTGDFSSGIVAQSVGGGGGSSGMNFNFTYNKDSNPDDGKKYNAALISVGGSGADAGDGDTVTIRHNGLINTDGLFSHGIVAQSIGGGGGSSSVNLGAGKLGDKTKAINFGLGGSNGAAGSGELVDVDHVGTIFTRGDSSMGIKAQSIGGGGGSSNGIQQLLDPILDFATGQLDSASIGINIGRKGGTGGTGGEVRVKSDGLIYTTGDQSIGILAQSIGGGGGDSGTTTVGGDFTAKSGSYGGNLAIGLDGGTAATGGVVTVTTSSEISTLGDRAHAIFALSLGGGGGMGGTVGDKLALSTGEDEDTTSADINIGGEGGDGSFSQQVTVNNSAQLFTYGDRSSGIWAQSIGGTGGAGGDYLLANIENIKGGKTSRSFSLNVGGNGGTGAVGGGVAVTNSGFIKTAGLQSFGIRAESIGGGGGDGGAVSQGRLVTGSGSKQTVDIKVGGTGGDGGKGSLVEVTNEGIIHTRGLGADGIRATSTGGGGGNAGVMIDTLLTLTGAESQTQSVSMNFGGSGGTGGTGGDVKVHNTRIAGERPGEIMTLGDSAHGVFAQSLGGGGGNGTSIISMTGLRNTKDSFAVGLNIGGSGGSGNFAGAVTVDNSGTISTEGKNAYGILAQSTGGGGGNGGMVLSASAAFGQDAKSPLLSIGGNGGDGRDGGSVTVTNSGEIFTSGDNGHGIVAQSIGGGGGNAGLGISASDDVGNVVVSNLISLNAGARGGGKGGTGGEVKVVQTGNVTVTGKGAQAIVAESINGGGGRLTVDFSSIVGLPGASTLKDLFGYAADEEMPEPAVASRLGGVDLSDMNAGKVSIETAGIFAVDGSNGTGAFEQSLGGGGGSLFLKASLGQLNDHAQLAARAIDSDLAAIPFNISLGGTGGQRNSGGDIKGISAGSIFTSGLNAIGLLSQSIGGGGGNAIVAISTANTAPAGPIGIELGSRQGRSESGGGIERNLNLDITTEGDISTAIQVQSVGGGGGSASLVVKGAGQPDLDLLLGAIDTNNSVGGDLNVIRNGTVTTSGRQSQAVSMQSIGGGGGRVVGSIESGLSQARITLGADPSFNNNAGNLNLNFNGDTSTNGSYSPGFVNQSIGAGGGQSYLSGLKSALVEVGATDGSTGNGGEIKISNIGKISTAGTRSDGIVMQSIGGGGGYVITDLAKEALKLITRSDNKGDGGNISFDQQGDITIFGDESFGIIAQSLAGGGGVVDRLFMDSAGGDGTSGSIAIHLNGSVLAVGKQSGGIFTQSRGSLGQGDIAVTLADGKFIRVNPDGVAVTLSGGANNLFDNRGAVVAANSDQLPEGLIFRGFEGNETIINRRGGLIFGDINLSGGNNGLTNEEGSYAALGKDIFIGKGPTQTFLNQGFVTPGDLGIYDSLITGNYEQTRTGALNINLDFQADQHDRLNITQKARLAGDLNVALSSIPLVKPGQRDLVFAATEGGIAEKELQLTIAPSIVADYGIKYDAFNAFLRVNVDFAAFGKLNPNQTAIGKYINRVQKAGSAPEMAPMISALFSMTELGPLKDAYNHLSPEIYTSTVTNLILASQSYADKLFSCDTKSGPNRFISESQCIWLDAAIGGYTGDRTDDYFGYQASAANLGAGIQWDLGKNWFASIGVGRTSYQTQFGDLISGNLDGFTNQAGVSIKKVMGATKVGVAFVGGFGNFQSDRHDVFPFGDTATASQNVSFMASRLRVSHDLEQRDWYVRPSLDFGISQVSQAGFRETGADAFNLVVSGGSTTTSLLAPAIQIGGEIKNGKLLIRPRAAVGYTHYLSDPSPEISARFAGAPGGVSDFQVTGLLDQDYLDLSAGIDLIFHNGVSLKLGYTGQFSANSTAHGAELRMAIPF